jgi:Leucine-rich repeat (LRR) protein
VASEYDNSSQIAPTRLSLIGYNGGMHNALRITITGSFAAWLTIGDTSQATAFWQRPVPSAEEADDDEPENYDDHVIDEPPAVPPLAARRVPVPAKPFQTFDEDAQDALTIRLLKLLDGKLENLSQEFGFSDQQRRKLRLAGKGDIKRLFDRIQRERKPFDSVDARQADAATRQKLLDSARALQQLEFYGPFGRGSILMKVLRPKLSEEQFTNLSATDEIRAWGGQISIVLRGGIVYKDVVLGDLTEERLTHLAGVPNIRSLTAELAHISDRQLSPLSRLTSLEVLDLSRTNIGDEGLVHIGRLPNLEVLRLRNTKFGNRGVAQLAQLSKLRELQIQGTGVTDEEISHLRSHKHLESLNLSRTRLTDAGFIRLNLAGFPQLRELSLSQTKISDSGISEIGNCPNLERLNLIGTQLTDSSVGALLNLNKLRHLLIDQTQITDHGLKQLADLAGLESIELSNTLASDIGLLALRPLTRLKYLNVANTRVTDDGVSEFHRALPDVIVQK